VEQVLAAVGRIWAAFVQATPPGLMKIEYSVTATANQ
jgi:hypothetical protein